MVHFDALHRHLLVNIRKKKCEVVTIESFPTLYMASDFNNADINIEPGKMVRKLEFSF